MNVMVFSTVAAFLQALLQRIATQFTFTFSVAHIAAGLYLAVEPACVRMVRVRAAEKVARRAAKKAAEQIHPDIASAVISFPSGATRRTAPLPVGTQFAPVSGRSEPADRGRQREARRAAQKSEAARGRAAPAVTAAAKAFTRAVREASGELAYETHGLDPARFGRRTPPFATPTTAPVPRVDAGGRALVFVNRKDGAIHYWYERRTPALVSDERRPFVAAIRAHPAAAHATAREARETFADALMDARAHAEAAMTEARHG
jgi:hypothetical protein